jgi:hypothetical protein
MMAAAATPSVTAGMIRKRIASQEPTPPTRPDGGSHPSCSENTSMSSTPRRKFGSDTPRRAKTMLRWSIGPLR